MLNKFFSKKFKVNKTNIFLFSFLLTQIAVPTFELFKPSSANADVELGSGASASGFGAIAIGDGADADSGGFSFTEEIPATAVGADANAVDNFSGWGGGTAIGSRTNASGGYSTAIGVDANAL